MADVAFISLVLAFFALCALYVRACDGIVRSGDDEAESPAESRQ